MGRQNFSHSDHRSHSDSYLVQLDVRGRIVLPKLLRDLLGLKPQEKLIASIKDGSLKITPAKEQIAKARGMLSKTQPKRVLSAELIAERRREARLE